MNKIIGMAAMLAALSLGSVADARPQQGGRPPEAW